MDKRLELLISVVGEDRVWEILSKSLAKTPVRAVKLEVPLAKKKIVKLRWTKEDKEHLKHTAVENFIQLGNWEKVSYNQAPYYSRTPSAIYNQLHELGLTKLTVEDLTHMSRN